MTESRDILRVGLLAPVESLDPRGAWEMGRALVASQVFETPYAVRGVSLEAEPLLFEEPPVEEASGTAGRPVFSARLREGIRFSDGSELIAAEAAAILGRSQALAGQAQVEARGERIFFTLERPNARFDFALTVLDCAMVRADGEDLIGTGPYVPAPGSGGGVRLIRNPHYRRPVAIPEIRFEVYPPEDDGTPRALLEAIESGEVDFTNVLTSEQQKPLKGVRRHSVPGKSTALLFFNTSKLLEPEARQAMAMAIDRKTLAALQYSDPITITNNTANGLLPPMLGWSLDGIMLDREKARELLRPHRAGLPGKLNLLVIWSPRPYLPQPSQVAAKLAEQLAAIGLEVEIELSTGAEDTSRRITAGEFDLYLGGWIADTPDPVDFLEALLSSEAIPEPGRGMANQANFSRWQWPAADEVLGRLRASQDDRDRLKLLRDVAQEVPVFPLLYGPATAVHSWRLEGFTLSPIGHPSFAEMGFRA